MNYPIVILGGYGTTGAIISRLFIEHTSYNIVIGGRSEEKGNELCSKLNLSSGTKRAVFERVDCGNNDDLRRIFKGKKLIINSASVSEYTEGILNVALESKVDFMDIQYSTYKNEILEKEKERILQSGIRYLTDGGFHPGLPSAMIRHLASRYTALESANVFSTLKVNWKALNLSQSTIDEFFRELLDFKPTFFQDSQWKTDFSYNKSFEFSRGDFNETCYPMYFDELKTLPDIYPSLKEMGFFIGGFNPIVNNILLMPMYMVAKVFGKISHKFLEKIFLYGLTHFSNPPYYTEIAIEANGLDGELRIRSTFTLTHDDAYVLTAVPAFACALQLLDGTISQKGLLFQGLAVETEKFFSNISQLGITSGLKQK